MLRPRGATVQPPFSRLWDFLPVWQAGGLLALYNLRRQQVGQPARRNYGLIAGDVSNEFPRIEGRQPTCSGCGGAEADLGYLAIGGPADLEELPQLVAEDASENVGGDL